jgi:Ca2+-binding RTX toxin-like protein
MADVTLSQANFNYDLLSDWHWTQTGTVENGLVYTNGSQQKITVTGVFNATGDFSISGKITQLILTQNGIEVFKATGLDADAATLTNMIAKGADSHTAFAYMLNGNDTIKGSSGDDVLYGYGGNDSIDGGKGFDTVHYSGAIANFKIARVADAWTVSDLKGGAGTDTLRNVELVAFDDKGFLPIDINGHSGQVARLYQAALDRAPDAFGLNYWEVQMDRGASLDALADAFVKSAEFRTLYGANPSNATLVGEFYHHILQREGDKAGVDFWTGLLDSHKLSVAQVLALISDSPENVQLSATVIGAGFVVDLPVMTI